MLGWGLGMASISALIGWVFFGSWTPQDTLSTILVMLLFGVHPFGALWMICDCIRRERAPMPYVLFAFVPYAFVWYYFERVRKRGATA